MKHSIRIAVALMGFVVFGYILAQNDLTFSGQLSNWEGGEAQLVLNVATGPPAPTLGPDSVVIGDLAADGSFNFTLPESMPEEALVPYSEVLGADHCEEASITPEDALAAPVAIAIYTDEGLVGGLFRANPEYQPGQGPPDYRLAVGYTPGEVTVQGRCTRTEAPVPFVDEFDFTVGPGWHQLVVWVRQDPNANSFSNDPVPEDAAWKVFRPPPPPTQ